MIAVESVAEARDDIHREVESLVTWMPQMAWASAHVQEEMLAGFANLRAVERYCRIGQAATRELSDLIGDPLLGTIDPATTKIISFEVDPDDHTIDIKFDWVEEVSADINKILVIAVPSCLAASIVIYFLFSCYCTHKKETCCETI